MRRLRQEIDLDTGVIVKETFYEGGRRQRHPANGPTCIQRYVTTGVVYEEQYRKGGELHREDGPACIRYDEEGRIVEEEYYQHGLYYRNPAEGPARTMWSYASGRGIMHSEEYLVWDHHCRDPREGPEWIIRDGLTGVVTQEIYTEPTFFEKMMGPVKPQPKTRQRFRTREP